MSEDMIDNPGSQNTGFTAIPGIFKAAVVVIYICVVMALTASSSGAPVNIDLTNPEMILSLKLAQMLTVFLLFVGPSFLFAHVLLPDRIAGLTLGQLPNKTIVFLSCILIIAAQPLINFLASMNAEMHLPSFMAETEQWMKNSEETLKKFTEAFLADKSIGGLILNLFIIAFLAAVGEELFFRGVLQKILHLTIKNVHVAVWLSAIIFSAVHMQFFGFIPRVILGAVLGYLFAWSGSLWVPIIVHFVNNGAAVLFSYFSEVETIKEMERTGGSSNDFIFVIASIIVTGGLMFLISKRKKEQLHVTSS